MRLRQPPYASVLTTRSRASIVASLAADKIYLQMLLLLGGRIICSLFGRLPFSISYARVMVKSVCGCNAKSLARLPRRISPLGH